MSSDEIWDSFTHACEKADIAIVEGAMGLYDGPEAAGRGSTAHLARMLGLPILLVVNCTRMTGSIAAMVSGYQHFRPGINIAGVILNNVSGKRHELKLKAAVEGHCGIPVVGIMPKKADLNLPQRHLGHIPFKENTEADSIISRICDYLEPHLDLDMILNIAEFSESAVSHPNQSSRHNTKPQTGGPRIGVIMDRVFSFYYPENIEALRQAGCEPVIIDSLNDQLPQIDGLIIGGGFPEFFLSELQANRTLRNQLASAIELGLPVYAECAGLMYLCRAITWEGKRHEMIGAIPAEVELSQKPQGHGYVEAEVVENNPLFPIGLHLKGHEFHHSRLRMDFDKAIFAYRLRRGRGIIDGMDGLIHKNVFASYTHLHALSTPQWAHAFTRLCSQKHESKSVISTLYN